MIGRIVWLAGLTALAMVATLAQLDRAARSQPALAALVPAPFRGFAAEQLTERAIIAKDAATALGEARRLVQARPLPAEHMRLLSQAAALKGESELALSAMAAATTRGWRDPVAQVAAGQSALLQGEYDAAAQRIGALFAVGEPPEQRDALLAALLAQPAGRAAFARKLVTPSRWRENGISMATQVVPPDQLAPTLAMAQAEGAALPCDRLATIAASYTASGSAAQAALFWPGNCPQP